jgi:hypothetical protein
VGIDLKYLSSKGIWLASLSLEITGRIRSPKLLEPLALIFLALYIDFLSNPNTAAHFVPGKPRQMNIL